MKGWTDLLGLSMSKLKGVFISHEHSDHIRGLEVFSRHYAIPIFMTQKTYSSYGKIIKASLLKFFSPDDEIKVGKIHINPFLKSHDGKEPCSFSVSSGCKNIAVLTDIGLICSNVVAHVKNADAVFLESNYDDHMFAGRSLSAIPESKDSL